MNASTSSALCQDLAAAGYDAATELTSLVERYFDGLSRAIRGVHRNTDHETQRIIADWCAELETTLPLVLDRLARLEAGVRQDGANTIAGRRVLHEIASTRQLYERIQVSASAVRAAAHELAGAWQPDASPRLRALVDGAMERATALCEALERDVVACAMTLADQDACGDADAPDEASWDWDPGADADREQAGAADPLPSSVPTHLRLL